MNIGTISRSMRPRQKMYSHSQRLLLPGKNATVGIRPRQSNLHRCFSYSHADVASDGEPRPSTAPLSTNASRGNNPQPHRLSALLACGAVASGASISGFGRESARCEPENRRFCGGSAPRESPSEPPDSDDGRDSLFDAAQQWALENLPERSDAARDRRSNVDSEPGSSAKDARIFSGPEQFLKSMGALGDKITAQDGGVDLTTPPDVTRQTTLLHVKDTMQKYIGKIQESIPKPQPRDSDATTPDKMSNQQTTNTSEESIMSDFLSFFFSSDKQSSSDMSELVRQAHSIVNPAPSSYLSGRSSSDSIVPSTGFLDQILYFKKNKDDIQRAFESSFGQFFSSCNLSISDLFETMNFATLHYFLEHTDSIKTPSWKRRVHRFYRGVEVERVEELNEALLLSELSYADGVEEVRRGLLRLSGSISDGDGKSSSSIADRFEGISNKPQWELLFCDIESRPNEPSHFLAVQKNASKYDDTLHVLMVVRGTKSMSDLMTDALLEATDYECVGEDGEVLRGKAHSGMVKAGKYLVQRHKKLLSTLVNLSNKRKIEIILIGHSLGAGAATIAAMEWNSQQYSRSSGNKGDVDVSAHVIGFGCPALLSQPLSLMTQDYVTTVIADADIIPRMSSATLVNLMLDLITFDYRKQAERDVEQALRELQYRFGGSQLLPTGKSKSKLPFSIDDDAIQKVMGYVHQGLDKVMAPDDSTELRERGDGSDQKKVQDYKKLEPVLFPPGRCIHFFRDGSGISGTYTPCTFYNEIDVARTMVDDHLISSGYRRIFLSMMRDFHKDDHFSFDSKRTEREKS